MRAGLGLFVLLLAGCGSAVEQPNGSADTNQIQRLARPKVEKQDPRATARLQPLTVEDLEREGLIGAGCAFRREGHLLLVAVGSDALVRIGGARRHLVHSSPVGPTGGFFEDRQISVSVGRTEENGAPGDGGMAWPATLKVTNRRTEAEVELQGFWTCGS
jgi:hypothetical protein